MARRNRPINMPAPYLRRVWLDPARIANRDAYPFVLPLLRDEFELSFDKAITIIVGENGTGKSTLLEGIAVMAGYDDAGGGKGYRSIGENGRLACDRTSRKLAAQDHQRLVLSCRELLLGGAISG